jgi:SAM-dependent methyltransferase
MERVIYDRMAEHDSTHWWYRARRDILASVISRQMGSQPSHAKILEIGCGTGHNIPMLQRFGVVDALEIDAHSAKIAAKRLGKPVSRSSLPELSGIQDEHYDIIALLDVLEHVEDDCAALRAIAKRLRTSRNDAPSGRLLLTVPQYPWMWSGHDVANHHFRRYTKASLKKVAGDSGLRLIFLSHFNSLLFPLAVADRMIARVTGREGSDDAQPAAPINRALESIFRLERHLVGRVPMLPGLSLIALFDKP